MNAPRAMAACLLGVALAGCAGGGGSAISEDTPGVLLAAALTPQAALAAAPGGQRKADVAAVLGKATVVPFDSGYEIWVYRWPGADRSSRAATELVILFDRSGRVARNRIRPGYPGEGR